MHNKTVRHPDKLDAAIAASLFELSPEQAERFEAELKQDPLMRHTFSELEEVISKVSYILPRATPPAFIKENLLRYAEESTESRLWGKWLSSIGVGMSAIPEAITEGVSAAASKVRRKIRSLSPKQAIGFSFVLLATLFTGAYAFENVKEFLAGKKEVVAPVHTRLTANSSAAPRVVVNSSKLVQPNLQVAHTPIAAPTAEYTLPKGSVVRIPDQIVSQSVAQNKFSMPDAKSITESIQTNFGTVEAYLQLSGDANAWSYQLVPKIRGAEATASVLWDTQHRDALLVVSGLSTSPEQSQYILQYILRDGSIVNALAFTTVSTATLYTFIPTAPGASVASVQLVLQKQAGDQAGTTVLLHSGRAKKNGK